MEFLDRKVTELPFTPDFIIRCGMMGFWNVKEIIYTKKTDLKKRNGFDSVWYEELEDMLGQRGMLNILKDPEAFLR